MLTLKNFEQQVLETILKRGKQYFEDGAVTSLDETEEACWQAEVEGSETYEVVVRLTAGNKVAGHRCTCPYDGEVCKHVVAVLFALRQAESRPAQKKAKAVKRLRFDGLLQKITAEEYRGFVRNYAAAHKSFRLEFELWFAARDGRIDPAKNYETLIRKIIRNHQDGGFVDYRATRGLYNEMDTLLRTGFAQAKAKNLSDAFALASTAIKELVPVFAYSDDSDGNIGAAAGEAVRLLETVLDDDDAAIALKEKAFEFLKAELSGKTYFDYGDTGYDLFDIFQRLALTLNRPDDFLGFIEARLTSLTGRYDDYRRDFLHQRKIGFLNATGNTAEATRLLRRHLGIVALRQGEVDKAIAKKDYGAAKALIADGIRIAEGKGHPGTVSAWQEQLLRIAVLENDLAAVRLYTRRFAFDRGFDKDYYRQWKKTFAPEEWKPVMESFITERTAQIKKEAGRHHADAVYTAYSLLNALAPLYVEEKEWNRLLALVTETKDFDSAWRYHGYLVKTHPRELLAIYLPALAARGDAASQRSDYAGLVDKMLQIGKDLPGSLEELKALAHRLKEKYPRRPAMQDELRRILE